MKVSYSFLLSFIAIIIVALVAANSANHKSAGQQEMKSKLFLGIVVE